MPNSYFCVKLCDVNTSYLYFYIYIHIMRKRRGKSCIKELLCEIVFLVLSVSFALSTSFMMLKGHFV